MSPTAPRRSRCSRRLGAQPPRSRTRRCWSPPRASCRSGSAPTAPSILREEGVEPMAMLSLLARIGTSQPVEPIAEPRRARARLRLCAFRPRARAFRSARRRAAERAAAPQAGPCGGRGSASGGGDGRGLAAAPTEPRAPVGFRALVRGAARRRGAPELAHDERLLLRDAAAIAEGLDWKAEPWRSLTGELEDRVRQEGPRAVPSASAGADRPGERPGNGRPRRADGQGPRHPAAEGRRQALSSASRLPRSVLGEVM